MIFIALKRRKLDMSMRLVSRLFSEMLLWDLVFYKTYLIKFDKSLVRISFFSK
ncbi:hypothetical protein GGR09_000748 [Bartonella heixiaziensis]